MGPGGGGGAATEWPKRRYLLLRIETPQTQIPADKTLQMLTNRTNKNAFFLAADILPMISIVVPFFG